MAVLHEGIHQSVFMSAIPPAPSQENPPFWEHHVKLLPGVSQITGNDVRQWSIAEVATFVASLPGCWEQEKVFKEQVRRGAIRSGVFFFNFKICSVSSDADVTEECQC